MSIQGVQGSVKTYVVGIIVCLILTLLPYYMVVHALLPAHYLVIGVVSLAVIQALVQLILFLHLGDEDHPRWNLMAFLFMALVLVIIVCGSLWIMHSLDERTMPGMHHQEGM